MASGGCKNNGVGGNILKWMTMVGMMVIKQKCHALLVDFGIVVWVEDIGQWKSD